MSIHARSPIRGRGMFDGVRERGAQMNDRVTNIAGMLQGVDNHGVEAKSVLRQFGNVPIVGLQLNRQPFTSALNWLLNGAMGGSFFEKIKSQPFDKLYHLRAIFRLSNGMRLSYEKTQSVKLSVLEGDQNAQGAETLDVTGLPQGLTINEVVRRTHARMGDKMYFTYNVSSNNCQVFVSNILDALGLSPTYKSWVMQNVQFVFENNPKLRPLINTTTTINRAVDYLSGAGIRGGRLVRGSAEARAWSERMRAARQRKKEERDS